MDLINHIRRLYDHLFWADQRVLDRLADTTAPVEASARLFAHVLAAEQVWLARLRGEDSSGIEIWPALSLAECAALARTNRFHYARYLQALTLPELTRTTAYRNSQGVEHRTSVRDILTHVALHGSYHRGQVALSLRAAGGEPVNTDFITFVREEPSRVVRPLLGELTE